MRKSHLQKPELTVADATLARKYISEVFAAKHMFVTLCVPGEICLAFVPQQTPLHMIKHAMRILGAATQRLDKSRVSIAWKLSDTRSIELVRYTQAYTPDVFVTLTDTGSAV